MDFAGKTPNTIVMLDAHFSDLSEGSVTKVRLSMLIGHARDP